MVDDYKEVFRQRAKDYHEAGVLLPHARHTERQIMVDWLDVEDHHWVCDLPAGGGYLSEGLEKIIKPTRLICIEPVWEFAQAIPPQFHRTMMTFSQLALHENSIDRIGSLTGLHHEENKKVFFVESFRILKSGGIVVVADVKVDTPAAKWLNGPVDQLSNTGHKGMFLSEGQLTSLMQAQGFIDIEEKHCEYTWNFPDWDSIILYCRKLFGLVKASDKQIRDELNSHFEISDKNAEVKLPWSLIYARGRKV